MAGKFTQLVADLQGELQALEAERTALTIQVNTLRAHKQEAETWLSQNWQKYSQAKADYAAMKQSARALAQGLEQAGV